MLALVVSTALGKSSSQTATSHGADEPYSTSTLPMVHDRPEAETDWVNVDVRQPVDGLQEANGRHLHVGARSTVMSIKSRSDGPV
jgi:hypothetical protein